MTRRTIGGPLDLAALSALATDPARQHRPDDPDVLAREARDLLTLGLSIPDTAQAIGVTPRALADLLEQSTDNLEE